MENPINQEDTVTNIKEPVKAEEPAASNSGERSDGTNSPPPNCSICLGKLINTSFTDSCLHQFCFTCLLQWSRIKTECPLCKQTFKSIIHNVRSEEDYDQYHVPREATLSSTQATASIGVTLALSNASMNAAFQRFAYRTTMTPNRRYGRHDPRLHPSTLNQLRQSSVASPQLPTVTPQERRQRRNIYRTGEWSDPVPDVYSRFRHCSAEYFRRYPQEVNRLIPWINRDLQTIFNSDEPHIAYVLRVITDLLTRYDMRSPEFRNSIRNFFGLETEHFIHELMNYASTDLSMAAYDDTITYYNSFPPHGLASTAYWHHVQSQTSSSTSSTISDDSDIRVVDHVEPSNLEVPSVGPHLISMPGPSTVSQAFQLQTPGSHPFVLTITSSSSESECEIVGYVKPRCERTPEIIELVSSGGEEVVTATINAIPEIESPSSSSLSPVNNQPSTSESSRRLTKTKKSKTTNTRQLDRLTLSSSNSDSEVDDSQIKKQSSRRNNTKHSTKIIKRSTRKSTSTKDDSATKKRNKHNYSSSDSHSHREAKCRRTSLSNSRKITRAKIYSSNSDDNNNDDGDKSSSRSDDEFKSIDKNDDNKITCRVRVRKDLINDNKKKHKRRTKRSSSTSSTTTSSSSSESDSSESSSSTTSTSLTSSSSYKYKINKLRKKKRSKGNKHLSKHKIIKTAADDLNVRHKKSRSRSKSKSRSRSRSRSRSESRSRSRSRSKSRNRSRETLNDNNTKERCSVNEKYRERKAAKIANKRLKNKQLYAMTDSQNDEESYRSNSQCSNLSDRHKTTKSNDKKYLKSDSNSKNKSHKTKSHKKSSKGVRKQKRLKTRGEGEKRVRRKITSSSSSSSLSSSS
ncbi:E3 ubiquitin-protein ligase Topors [Microplitis demolitor]|uniref:E3 ubiquitin-protein ligase Topors n=1 Tax=Microplitis demolitor TaxID=69319 RepID=UPI0004CD4A0F|nr:E3 ubiquitin-protein ligase Topors [Microplitis demolitor]